MGDVKTGSHQPQRREASEELRVPAFLVPQSLKAIDQAIPPLAVARPVEFRQRRIVVEQCVEFLPENPNLADDVVELRRAESNVARAGQSTEFACRGDPRDPTGPRRFGAQGEPLSLFTRSGDAQFDGHA
jgi:hypothetical protein